MEIEVTIGILYYYHLKTIENSKSFPLLTNFVFNVFHWIFFCTKLT